MQHIQPWFVACARPTAGKDSEVLATFWEEACLAIEGSTASFPEGHHEVEQGTSRVQSFLSTEEQVACLRIVRDDHGKRAKLHIIELVWAHLESKGPIVGIRAWSTLRRGAPVSSGHDVPTTWASLRARGLIYDENAFSVKLPYFDQIIATIRSAAVGVPHEESSNTIQQADMDELLLELDYHKELALNQAKEIKRLTSKIQALQANLETKSAYEDIELATPVVPKFSLAELPLWAAEHESELIVHPRAFTGAKRSLYENDSDILKGLEFLAGPFRQSKMGLLPLPEYQQALNASGFKFSGSVTYGTAASQGDSYFVRYKGQRVFLEFHLVKGGGRDPRYCLRIYFFWDNDEKKVVVGWLPSHLDCSFS